MGRKARVSVVPDGRAGTAVTCTLRGEAKLAAALALFAVDVRGCAALDAGAAAGGFTRALLSAGARRVYAVDAGYGRLLGSLRQDPRVVNLERTNLGRLGRRLVPELIEIVTLDLSYLSLAGAVPQLSPLELGARCVLIGLVKPQFELGVAAAPSAEASLDRAVALAAGGIAAAGWQVLGSARSPVLGARGSVEFLIHARKETL
jgi:23S rRNA (cytidine1920-2'-O)/16S rRNA (cytidine1409-2'-O)-methyltransferase